MYSRPHLVIIPGLLHYALAWLSPLHTDSPASHSIGSDRERSSLDGIAGVPTIVSHAVPLPCSLVCLAYRTIATNAKPNTKTMVRQSPNSIQGDSVSVSGLPWMLAGLAARRYPGVMRMRNRVLTLGNFGKPRRISAKSYMPQLYMQEV